MLLFLSGQDSFETAEYITKILTDSGFEGEIYHLNEHDPNANRHALSFMSMMVSNFSVDIENSPLVIFSAEGLWFLQDRIGMHLELLFETMGGILLTDDRFSYESLTEREEYPSYQKESYNAFPKEDTEGYERFIMAFLEYGEMRGKTFYDLADGQYYGDVLGSPRTIFVLGDEENSEVSLKDLEFITKLRLKMIPEHGNHIGIVPLSAVKLVQEISPFSGYVAVGSPAYEYISKNLDEDIVKAGIPDPNKIKGWGELTSKSQDRILHQFARLASRAVESGERKTSMIHLN